MIPSNREVLAVRFPSVLAWIEGATAPRSVEVPPTPSPTLWVNGLQLASGYDAPAEAALQARLVPHDSSQATCYGIGTGCLPRALLARPALERLEVVLFHPGVARAVLERFDSADWLGDPRLELVPAAERTELSTPFAAAPACLRLADDEGSRLRDLVFLELATPHLRRHVERRAGDLAARFEENRALLLADGDVASLFGTHRGSTVWVAGAGPTLPRRFEELARRPDAQPLFAVDAALAPLLEARIVPDVVLTMDAHREHQLPLFAGDLAKLVSTPLVYAPAVHGDVLRRWPGPRLAMYEGGASYERLRGELPRATLWSSGSIIHPTVDLAVRTGASTVRFCGMDFAHVGGRSHAEGSHHARDDVGEDVRAGASVLDGRGERVSSLPNLVGYLRDLERYVARNPVVTFVNPERDGARIEGAVYPEELR